MGLIPNESVLETIELGSAKHKKYAGQLDEIERFLANNPLIVHDKTLVEKLKVELGVAFERSEIEAGVREIVKLHEKQIDTAQEKENREIAVKRQEFQKLLDAIKSYIKSMASFSESLSEI